MKKQITVALTLLMLVSGSAVAVNRFNAEPYAKADTYEHMDM